MKKLLLVLVIAMMAIPSLAQDDSYTRCQGFSFVQVSMEELLWMLVINLIRISKPLWVVVPHLL